MILILTRNLMFKLQIDPPPQKVTSFIDSLLWNIKILTNSFPSLSDAFAAYQKKLCFTWIPYDSQ